MPGCGWRAWSRCARRRVPARVLRVLMALLTLYMFVFLIQVEFVWLIPRGHSQTSHPRPTHRARSPCPNLLTNMACGHWVPNNVGLEWRQELKNFMAEARSQYNLPSAMERDDRKCGNVSFASTERSDNKLHFFRATCSPDGPTPCCRLGRCVSDPQSDCDCTTCVDLRRELHAETATWTTDDSLCAPRHFSPESACLSLVGTTFVLAGDSLIRQLYVSFLLMLTGNFHGGALGSNVTQDIRQRCSGLRQYTAKDCYQHIPSTRSLCQGTVNLVFIPCQRAMHVQKLLESLPISGRTLIVTSIGLQDSFDAQLVTRRFLLPLMRHLEQSEMMRPEMLWLTTHASGTLSFAPERSGAIVKKYNSDITRFLDASSVPVLDVYPLTLGIASPDGVHFGHGVNDVKVRMILTYLYHRRFERDL